MVFSDIVKHNGKYYRIESLLIEDYGYKTLVFPCKRSGNVTSYWDLYCESYATESTMKLKHMQIIDDIKTGRMIFNG